MYKLIKLKDKFILVSDEKPIIHQTVYLNNFIQNLSNQATLQEINEAKTIIAGYGKLPSIDFSLLSEDDCKRIRYADVEKLARRRYGTDIYAMEQADDFIAGFKTAQSLNDKMFSLDDILNFGLYLGNNLKKFKNQKIEDIFNNSPFKEQTSWDVEVNENNQIIKIL